jgi:hypothetical protein
MTPTWKLSANGRRRRASPGVMWRKILTTIPPMAPPESDFFVPADIFASALVELVARSEDTVGLVAPSEDTVALSFLAILNRKPRFLGSTPTDLSSTS